MDYILIKDLIIYAYHGVLPEEKQTGQNFVVTAKLYFDLRKPGDSDDLEETIHYGHVCELIEEVMTETKYDLIEAVAHNVANAILLKYHKINKVEINLSKPNAPIDMDFDTVAVCIERSRHYAYLGLGSNLGDKEAYLDYAIDQLNLDDYIKVTNVSSFISTKPYGEVEQDDFLNGCVKIETLYSANELLTVINDIEKGAGRKRIIHWGPRTLDIDILLFDDLIINEENLCIPHIEMSKRRFVLEPLCEIASHLLHPIFGKTMGQLLNELPQEEVIETKLFESYKVIDELNIDKNTKCVYQGVPGAYGEMATDKFFGEDIIKYNIDTFTNLANEVANKKADYGVLPIENSTAGFVKGIYDILLEYDVNIVSEVVLDINHELLGIDGTTLDSIKCVYSHPQGLLQCEDFIKKHGYNTVSMENTAVSAQKVKEENSTEIAAIASDRAANMYGLNIIDKNISVAKENATRFVVITNKKQTLIDSGRISICFSVPHKSGSLYGMLKHFIENGINMTSIESRPIASKQWQYYFYITIEGKLTDNSVQIALTNIKNKSSDFKILGMY